jgi:hypothetical protein
MVCAAMRCAVPLGFPLWRVLGQLERGRDGVAEVGGAGYESAGDVAHARIEALTEPAHFGRHRRRLEHRRDGVAQGRLARRADSAHLDAEW